MKFSSGSVQVFIAVFILLSSLTYGYEVSLFADKYVYAENESIYAKGIVKQNNTPVSNVTVAFQAKNTAGTVVNSTSLVTNSSGYFNHTFSIASLGNFTLVANASGDYVQHFIKVKAYADVLTATDKATYTVGANGTLSVKVIDASGNGVSSQVVSNNLRHGANGTLVSNLSSCTTNSLGECKINFTAPSLDGQYMIESNNFEGQVFLFVGGFDAVMKVSSNVLGLNNEVTVRVTVKNANGNGVAASTRQLVITFPNSTEYTVTSMTQAVDSSGTSLTGVYEDRYNATGEGLYKVKATVVAQGSNITRELSGSFEVRGYVMDIVPWSGQSVFYPGSSIALGVKLRNASNNEFLSGKTSTILSGASVLDPSDQPFVVNISVSEFTSLSSYRTDFVVPATASPGSYKLKVSLNDSVGTGSGTGYFTIQLVRASASTLDKFNGSSKTTFLAAQPIVVKIAAKNASGVINITGVTAYSVRDSEGNDKTSLFGTVSNITAGGDAYLNLTAPNKGGDYRIKVRVSTGAGPADAEGSLFIDVLDIDARPVSIGGSTGAMGGFMPHGGPGFMFAFRPNDTVSMNITVKSASEKQEGEGFMGKFAGPIGGPSVSGGLFGIGGGTVSQGAQVKVEKIININTDEDVTSTTTGTLSCVTDSSGVCTIKLQPTTNGNNWTGGFYTVFMNATTTDNQTDDGDAFFEVRRYFVDVRVQANVQDNASSLGFNSFNSWNIGPNDGVIVNVSIREPGTWATVPNTFNVTVLGFYYGGKIGEFIYPPKLIEGTTKSYLTNQASGNGTTISAPSGGWKSGFYQVKVSINTTGQIDSGEGFIMSRIYEGFGMPVNPTTLQQDFTARSTENITLRISVYDVQKHRPAANLTVTNNKIMSFSSFPPSELTYSENVTQGTTDANGAVIMTLPVPGGGWPKGSFLAVFDVTNGSASDSVEGFFQVKNFFAELSTSKWSFSTNETVPFNVTISSDPSWMRNMFGGCPPGDPGCSGGGGGPGGGGGSFVEPTRVVVNANISADIDGDGIKDINITFVGGRANISLVGNLTNSEKSTQNLSLGKIVYCGSESDCVSGAVYSPARFDGFSCLTGALNTTDFNYKNHSLNFSGPAIVCVKSSRNTTYKVSSGPVSGLDNITLEILPDVGGLGGSSSLNVSSSSGISYMNASLKSIKVARFDFSSGETVLTHGVDYNVTSANGVLVGTNITILGTGGIKIKPIGTLSTGFYRVVAEFNTSDGTETTQSGFMVETFTTSCYRPSWLPSASGTTIEAVCSVLSPNGAFYQNNVQMAVESLKSTQTGSSMSGSLWSTTTNFTNSTESGRTIHINQSLPTGFYEAVIKLNDSSSTKRTSIWFEVKDFDAQFWSSRWSYSALDNISFTAKGTSGLTQFRVNVSADSLSVFKYDRATWAKSTVSGVILATQLVNVSELNNYTIINLSKSGGWDEGQYQVTLNLTKINAAGTAIGSPAEVYSWFDVKLFDVSGYATQWSYHPKDNVTLKIFVGDPSGFYGTRYTSRVTVNVTEVKNTQTGAILTAGTDYNAIGITTIPSVTGDVPVNITPVGSLPAGSYKAKVSVTDSVSGRTVTSDVYFNAISFYFSAWAQNYELGAGENVTISIYTSKPTGGSANLSNVNITVLQFCNVNYTCSNKDLASFNYTFVRLNSQLLINTTGFAEGWYSATLAANDTQDSRATASAYFRIKSFAVGGYIRGVSGSRTGGGHQINETWVLNVTSSLGVNITNATVYYSDCSAGPCSVKSFFIGIGYNMTANNVLLNLTPANITPAILNNTWPVASYASYSVYVYALKDGSSVYFPTYTYVYFPQPSVSGPSSASTGDGIAANITVYVEPMTGQNLSGANITVTDVLQDTGFALTSLGASRWNVSSKIADSSGIAELVVQPNGSAWPSGKLRIRYSIVYGNASTIAEFSTTTASRSLGFSKKLTNVTHTNATNNATVGVPFNVSITLNNPSTVDSNGTYLIVYTPVHSTNTSAIISLLNNSAGNATSEMRVNVTAGNSATVSWMYNASAGAGNYTQQILLQANSTFNTLGWVTYSNTVTVGSG